MTRVKCNVLLLEYRGYGLSGGTVSEEGIKIDAQTALDYLLDRKDLQSKDIYIFGRSIGGAVAIDLAAHNSEHVTGLIIENTFTSVAALVGQVMPIFGYFAFLLTHRWASLNTMTRVQIATLVLSGRRASLFCRLLNVLPVIKCSLRCARRDDSHHHVTRPLRSLPRAS